MALNLFLLAVDPLPKLFMGDSESYLWTAWSGWILLTGHFYTGMSFAGHLFGRKSYFFTDSPGVSWRHHCDSSCTSADGFLGLPLRRIFWGFSVRSTRCNWCGSAIYDGDG